MPVNVVCPILGTPINSSIFTFKTYSMWAHTVIKRDGVGKVLDDLLESKKDVVWEVRCIIPTIRQLYPHALHDPRLRELVKRHVLKEWTYKGGA